MKSLSILLILCASVSAFAAPITTLCGMNKTDGEKIRLEIVLEQEDEFADAEITSINGQKPARLSPNGASGFGFRGYENIKLTLSGCAGSATYSHYDKTMPMNPMETLTLKCVCK